MAKSKNHSNPNQNYKAHRNGIKKPARVRWISTKGVRAALVLAPPSLAAGSAAPPAAPLSSAAPAQAAAAAAAGRRAALEAARRAG
jgi:large subunit ribosomal protein L29e